MEIEENNVAHNLVGLKVKNKISKPKNKDEIKVGKRQNKKSQDLEICIQQQKLQQQKFNQILNGKIQQIPTHLIIQQQTSDDSMKNEISNNNTQTNIIINDNNSTNDQQIEKQQEHIRIVEMDIIPIVRHLKMQTVYMLAGDVMVDLDFGMKEDEHPICQISAINSFKNPIRVEMLKDQMSSEVDLTISQDSLKEFGKIIEILENYPQQYAHDFGKVLRQYQIFVTGQLKKAKFLKDNAGFKSLIPTFDSQYEEFLADVRNYLKANVNQNKFQFYMIVKSNVQSFTHDISRFGLSEGLCQLLGGNGDQICSLILRRGLFEFFSKDTRNNFYFYYLSNLLNVKDVQIDKSISLVTLDGIELKVDYEMVTYFGKDAEPNVLFFYPHILIMINFEVKPYMVKQVLDIRESLDSETQQFMREFEEDVYYSLESQIFLENYYADYYNKILQNNGQSLPKEKRKYKKHPQTKHQLDFRQQNQTVISSQKQIKNSSKSQSSQSRCSLSQISGGNEEIIEESNDQKIQLKQEIIKSEKEQQNIIEKENGNNNDNNNIQNDSQIENEIFNKEDDSIFQNQQSENFDIFQDNHNNNSNQSSYYHAHPIYGDLYNQYPYISQNYMNYENLNVQDFNTQHLQQNQDKDILGKQQKIQLQENISIYQASLYANQQKQEFQKQIIQNDNNNNNLNQQSLQEGQQIKQGNLQKQEFQEGSQQSQQQQLLFQQQQQQFTQTQEHSQIQEE